MPHGRNIRGLGNVKTPVRKTATPAIKKTPPAKGLAKAATKVPAQGAAGLAKAQAAIGGQKRKPRA